MDRIEDIYQKALTLFMERGYDNTPLSLVAKETGLSKGGIYHYFESKEHLLFLIHRHQIQRTLDPILERAEQEPDPERRLAEFFHDYVAMATKDQTTQMVIHEAKRLQPEHYREIQQSWRRVVDMVSGAIRELKERGQVSREINTTFATFGAIGMCVWTSYWFDPARPESAGELARTLAHIFIAGLKAQPELAGQ
ncbi:MAG: TetR/AcrR family transcriptional regulator [Pseudomonadota bacterium]